MSTYPSHAAPGYQFISSPDISRLETRERLSHSAIEGFFAVTDQWNLSMAQKVLLLGDNMPRSSAYKLRTIPRTLSFDVLTRISYVVGIYKALHILLPEEYADKWMTRPNDNSLFRGQAPLDYIERTGILGMQQVRSLIDAA